MPSNTHIHHGLGWTGVLGRMPPTSTAAVYVDGRDLNNFGDLEGHQRDPTGWPTSSLMRTPVRFDPSASVTVVMQ